MCRSSVSVTIMESNSVLRDRRRLAPDRPRRPIRPRPGRAGVETVAVHQHRLPTVADVSAGRRAWYGSSWISADERAILDEMQWGHRVAPTGRGRAGPQPDADLLSYSDLPQGSWFTRGAGPMRRQHVALAWLAFRRRGTFFFANAENTALPLALLFKLRRGSTLAFIGHRLTTPLKTRFIRGLDLLRHIGMVFCYSGTQAQHLINRLGVARRSVCGKSPFRWTRGSLHPRPSRRSDRDVVSVGREMRDYPTLFAALDSSGVPVTVVASSPWSKRADQTAGRTLPGMSPAAQPHHSALRDGTAGCSGWSYRSENVDFPAGITALLEAQACGRPVVVSSSAGSSMHVEPGTAVLVPCGDPAALRGAVLQLIEHPDEAKRVAERARESVVRDHTLSRVGRRALLRVVRRAEIGPQR